ncbi:hypothetical protein V2J09_013271 [Rumex salicifolius]
MPYQMNELKKAGLGLVGFGIFFTFLGVVLFFDKGLLALGNILWLIGVSILLGRQSMLKLLTSRVNYKGSLCFFGGLFFLFVRWPLLGIILEIYGCFLLFGSSLKKNFSSGFWPTMRIFLSQIPGVGWVIKFFCPCKLCYFLIFSFPRVVLKSL